MYKSGKIETLTFIFGSRGSKVRILSPRLERIPHVSDERALFHDKALFILYIVLFLSTGSIIINYNQIYPFGGHKSGGHSDGHNQK